MQRLNRRAKLVGLLSCVVVSIVSALHVATRTGEIGSTSPFLYVFFVGFLGTLLFVRSLTRRDEEFTGSKPVAYRVFHAVMITLCIAGIAYMLSFLGGFFIAGPDGMRVVAENVVWFLVGGILVASLIQVVAHFRK